MYYPIMINLKNKRIVLFGGGRVAYRKCQSILGCGGQVIVISKDFLEEFYVLKEKYKDFITLIEGVYQSKYIHNCYLVVAATNSKETNDRIYQYCQEKNILCNVVDDGEKSDYILPSTVRRGDLLIAISTAGKSPSLSKKIKQELQQKYPPEYKEYLNLLGSIRGKILRKEQNKEERKRMLNSLVDMSLEQLQELLDKM